MNSPLTAPAGLALLVRAWCGTWRKILTDPGALLLMVIAPLGYSLFYAQPYLRDVVREVPLVVVDLDHTSLSRQLVRYADAHETLRVSARVNSLADAETLVSRGVASAYLLIPTGFRADVLRGREAELGYGGDASYFLTFKQTLGGLAEAVGTAAAKIKMSQRFAAGQSRESAATSVQPARLHLHPVGNTRESYAGYLIPAVFVLILQQTLVLGVGLIAGTARESASASPRRPQLAEYLGTSAALAVLYLGHAAFHAGFGLWLYDLPRHGSLLNVAVFTVPLVVACVFFAQSLAGFCSRREQSIHLFLLTSIPFLFIAGVAWPAELMPAALRWISLVVPSSLGIAGMVRVNQLGASLADVAPWLAGLWGLGAVYALFGWKSFGRWGAETRC